MTISSHSLSLGAMKAWMHQTWSFYFKCLCLLFNQMHQYHMGISEYHKGTDVPTKLHLNYSVTSNKSELTFQLQNEVLPLEITLH